MANGVLPVFVGNEEVGYVLLQNFQKKKKDDTFQLHNDKDKTTYKVVEVTYDKVTAVQS